MLATSTNGRWLIAVLFLMFLLPIFDATNSHSRTPNTGIIEATFEDAEQSANPVVFDKSITWQKVKASIQESVKKLG